MQIVRNLIKNHNVRHFCGFCNADTAHEVLILKRKQPAADLYREWEAKEISSWPKEMQDKYRFESDRFTEEEIMDLTVKEIRCIKCGTVCMSAKSKRFKTKTLG